MKYRYIYNNETKEIEIILIKPDYDCIQFLNRVCKWKFTANWELFRYILPSIYTVGVISNILHNYGGVYDFEILSSN